jgi:hypothetical protein
MKAIMVLGMHRSGTSAIAKAISLMGAEFGDNLLSAQSDNKKGFWEDEFIVEYNDSVLKKYGHEWYTVGDVSIELDEIDILAIQTYIKDSFSIFPYWGFKDPRLCRLLPLWNYILDLLDYDVLYCVAIRNPLSVIESLKNRNEFTIKQATLLWYQYNIDILKNLYEKPFVIIDFDELISNPKENIYRVASGLNLEEEIDEGDLSDYCDSFLNNKLRHSNYSYNDLYNHSMIHDEVKELYKFMIDMTKNYIVSLSHDELKNFTDKSELWHEINNNSTTFNEIFKNSFSLKERLSHTEESLNIAKLHLAQTLNERDSLFNEKQHLQKYVDTYNSGSLLIKRMFEIIKMRLF